MARLTVRVTPRAGRDAIDGERGGILRVRVRAAPADGEANDAARRLIARTLGIAPSNVRLIAGAAARTKTFEIAGFDGAALQAALSRQHD